MTKESASRKMRELTRKLAELEKESSQDYIRERRVNKNGQVYIIRKRKER